MTIELKLIYKINTISSPMVTVCSGVNFFLLATILLVGIFFDALFFKVFVFSLIHFCVICSIQVYYFFVIPMWTKPFLLFPYSAFTV